MTLPGLRCPACGERAVDLSTKAQTVEQVMTCRRCEARLCPDPQAQFTRFAGSLGGIFVAGTLAVLFDRGEFVGPWFWGLLGASLGTLLLSEVWYVLFGRLAIQDPLNLVSGRAPAKPILKLETPITLKVDPKAQRCPFCHDGLDLAQAVSCVACNAAHHGECWDELGKCATCARSQRTAA